MALIKRNLSKSLSGYMEFIVLMTILAISAKAGSFNFSMFILAPLLILSRNVLMDFIKERKERKKEEGEISE